MVTETRPAVERWERRTEIPLMLLALAFLVAYAWPVLDPRINPDLRTFLSVVSWTVWAAFALDFAIRLFLAHDRKRYAAKHWYDVASWCCRCCGPFGCCGCWRSCDLGPLGGTQPRRAGVGVRVRGCGARRVPRALAVLDAEEKVPKANIKTFGDALWWAATTVTTVGYGDHSPITLQGRLVAVVLMVIGIGVVGAVTASVATWILGRVADERAERERPTDE